MHLAADYIHPLPARGRCRVRLYLPEEDRDAAVVIATELQDNPGQSITRYAERLAAEVIEGQLLSGPLVWIEHYPPESTNQGAETFEMVSFSDYEVREDRTSYMGRRAIRIGDPAWKPLDRRDVEMLIGGEV